MTNNKDIKSRHKEAHKALKVAFEDLPQTIATYKHIETIAKSLGISKQTVYNYIKGTCRDGFLTEAITQECLNINK